MARIDILTVEKKDPILFDRLSIADVKLFVGAEALNIQTQNKWIAIFFPRCCVKIRKW